ncbi:aminodeoxychorismate synthase component I [Anaerostipes sp.]|uniref:aminodeoxychorismate synthase component I n=1 Tax=Anaerostipes sp. TaxID=1872530 RepID=UPI0025BE9AAA|nr:aminodeoxychorismate synthase component I [Anaerostipes sp.]MBS7009224.1 aminodeoxychorismate synthase component I [Anaerostipes sp.]
METKIKRVPFYKDPAEIFHSYREEAYAVFLDSSLENDQGRYSVIGLNPYLILKQENGKVSVNGTAVSRPLEDVLGECLEARREENPTQLPLVSGAVGYFSYDYGRQFEHILSRHKKEHEVPEAVFVFYDNLIIADQKKEQLYMTAGEECKSAEDAFREMEQTIRESICPGKPRRQGKTAHFIPDFQKEEYKKAVEQMISYIEEGDIYIANMTQQLKIPGKGRCYDVFQYLRFHNPSPFGAYMNYGDFQVICASPERFLKVTDGTAVTRPIKGTRKRGQTSEEDDLYRQELLESEKDRSELLMIVDLERNDLNCVCTPGTVRVPEHCAAEQYATVFHLVSTVTGELREGTKFQELLRAMFPGGSVTGAPKIHAMEIIDRLERSQRGIYTGSIGYISLNGDCDFNIVIRTAVYKDGVYRLGAGGGITWESDPEFEYEETMQKAKAVLEAIAGAEGGQDL